MLQSITHSISREQPHFEIGQIVLWHIARIPVTGVVVSAHDETEQATIKIRNLAGHTQCVTVAYSEIEVRS